MKTSKSIFIPQKMYKKSMGPTSQATIDQFFMQINSIKDKPFAIKPEKVINPKLQRLLDIALSASLTVPASILVLVSAFITKIAEPNKPVFHKQKRYGINGKSYSIYKIRTVEKTPDGWRMSSRFSQALRKYSIDELPQLLNVLKGNMSLMGPRAMIFKDTNRLLEEGGAEYMAQRLSYKPGFGFGYEKGRKLNKSRVEIEKDFFKNHGTKQYFKTILSLVKTIIKGHNK